MHVRGLFAVAAVVWVAGLASTGAAAERERFKLIHVDDLVKRMAHEKVYVCDANDDDLRKKAGIIPGAHLLSSVGRYDVASELPAAKDTPLVFYCANTH